MTASRRAPGPAPPVPDEYAGELAKLVRAMTDELLASAPGDVHRRMVSVVERELLTHALAVTDGNQLRAARLLGVNRNTLHKRAVELGVLPNGGAVAVEDAG